VPFESRLPDLLGGGPGEFLPLNPRLEVPPSDGEVAVFDSTIILEYRRERWPKIRRCSPSAPGERARVRMLEELCDTALRGGQLGIFGDLVFPARQRISPSGWRRASQPACRMQRLPRARARRRAYFNGDTFGWGDIAVIPFVHAAAVTGGAHAGDRACRLARASWAPQRRRCYSRRRQSMTGFEMLPQLVASGQFRREYRDHRLEWMLRSGGVDVVLDGLRKGNIRFSRELE
jgi:glutathione S-transferase/RNA polymerase-associated protein